MSDPFEDLYLSYDFAVFMARQLSTFEHDEELSKRGLGHFKSSDLSNTDNLSKIRKSRIRKLRNLLSAVQDLSSENDYLDVANQIDEWMRDHSSAAPVKWHALEEACKEILATISRENVKGRPKNKRIDSILKCYLMHLSVNNISPTFFINAGKPSKNLLQAKQFLEDAEYRDVQSFEALAEMLKQLRRR